MSRSFGTHRLLAVLLTAAATTVLAVTALAPAAAATAGASAAKARCHTHGRHCPAPLVPNAGDFSSKPTADTQPYVEVSTTYSPLRVSGRARLLYTCQPSGSQTLLYAGISQTPIRFSGTTFKGSSPMAGPIELVDEATAGTITVSGRFTSRSTVTVTVQVSGLAVPRIFPSDGTAVEGPQTCAAAPATFKLSQVQAPSFRPPRA